MSKEITQNEQSIAHEIGFSDQQVAILKETAFKDLKNSAERGAALMICSKYKLDLTNRHERNNIIDHGDRGAHSKVQPNQVARCHLRRVETVCQ